MLLSVYLVFRNSADGLVRTFQIALGGLTML